MKKNEFIFTVEWMRDYFNCNDKYPNTGDFVKRVIDGAVKAIVKNTLMRLSYRTVKKGRSITHIVFKLNEWSDQDFTDYRKKLREADKESE